MSSAQTIIKSINHLLNESLYLAKLYEHLSVHGDALDVQRLVGDLDAAPAADDHRVKLAGGAYLQKRRKKRTRIKIRYQKYPKRIQKDPSFQNVICERCAIFAARRHL